ncbi:MAG: EamA/RhaT family transporter [Flavobacteriales bacterium]|nr:EamA/RhaT family transporter [Flavobacteriales bacterium]
MIWLLLSVASSTIIFVLFRLFPKYKAHTLPAIVVNYAVAATLGMVMLEPNYNLEAATQTTWFKGGLMVGVLFISIFFLMAFTAQRMGVAISSIATKMSLVIPVAWFMATDPNDYITGIKIVAVLLALLAVLLSSKRSEGNFNWSYIAFPVIVFLGSGVIDLVIGHFSDGNQLQSESDRYLFTSAPFMTSMVIGIVALIIRGIKGMPLFNWATVIGGIILGLVNFASIYFLIATFESKFVDRSAIIPINNLGVVLFSSLLAVLFFSEKASKRKLIGLAFAVLSIALLIFNR